MLVGDLFCEVYTKVKAVDGGRRCKRIKQGTNDIFCQKEVALKL